MSLAKSTRTVSIARLEGAAPAGGILVSRAVQEAVDGRLKASLNSVGELSLKNIDRPIAAFRVEWLSRAPSASNRFDRAFSPMRWELH